MESVKKGIDKALYWISVILFALLVAVVVWQVFSRQVLGDPATWTDEGARLTFVWLGLFASALVFGERAHIAVEFVVRKLPTRGEQVAAIIVQLVVLTFAVVVLVWGGWRASQNAWNQELSALPFTFGQMYLALPVAGVLIAFYSAYYVLGLARSSIDAYADHSVDDDPELQLDKYAADESIVLTDVDDTIQPGTQPGTQPSNDSPEDGDTNPSREA